MILLLGKQGDILIIKAEIYNFCNIVDEKNKTII